jgi:Fic family protein
MSSLEAGPKDKTALPAIDTRKADADYKSFPSFAEWQARSNIDTGRWERYTALLQERGEVSSDLLRNAREVVKRAAAVDTGAIEGLYEVDRGFTFTIATEAVLWEAALDKKGEKVRALFESQLRAYEYVLDLATQQVPIAEAWIRKLHEEICQGQDVYTAYTEIGIQQLPLPKGTYKNLPNHVITRDGEIHAYAPVDLTPAEMHRLCAELRSEAFLAAHPVLQSSYAHYAFVAIHPFADGNGRVARALASVFTYRAQSVPVLILVDNRNEYYLSLAAADAGEIQPFVDFMLERALDAIRLADESLRAAIAPSMQNALADLKSLYVTRGGYTHSEVDEAGYRFMEIFQKEVNRQMHDAVEKLKDSKGKSQLSFEAPVQLAGYEITRATSRAPISDGPRKLHLLITSASPANSKVERTFGLEVPKDCGREDDLIIQNLQTHELFEARVTELIPGPSAALQMRVSMAVERILADALAEMRSRAAETLRGRGY